MVKVVGVRFKKAGKIYYFDPDEIELETGVNVIVETARGLEFGRSGRRSQNGAGGRSSPTLEKKLSAGPRRKTLNTCRKTGKRKRGPLKLVWPRSPSTACL